MRFASDTAPGSGRPILLIETSLPTADLKTEKRVDAPTHRARES